MKFGLNLFSIRNLIQTEKEFLDVAIKLKDAGYSYMQFSGAPYNPDAIKKVVNTSGMPVYLTHVPMDRITDDADKLMEEHLSFGCKNIGLGMMPAKHFDDDDDFKRVVEKLNKAGEYLSKNGFKFFYHHHHYELTNNLDGGTRLEYMINNAKHINFTLDTYWLQYGGVDILSYIDKMQGRIDCVHLKDYKIVRDLESEDIVYKPRFAPVGYGNIDFNVVINKMKNAGVKYYFVEQDDAVSYDNPLEQVIMSANYIKKELI